MSGLRGWPAVSNDLQTTAQPLQPSPVVIERLTMEFLRVLGLLVVVVGRKDYIAAASGATLLRNFLIQLMVEDVAVPDRGGALHQSALLPQHHREQLYSLPAIAANSEAVIAAHVECAKVFLPLARQLTTRCDVGWPHALEDATRAYLSAELGVLI